MFNMPKISVIVPVYNVEKYLAKCIDSILAQTFTDFECILINDGSPDNSPAICDEYAKKDERMKVIHKENGGVSSARNTGLDIAQGEWITFADSDDWVDENYLELMYSNAIKNNCDLSICGFKSVDEKGNINAVFSIIVPIYKVEKYLDECVQSVLPQSFTDYECVLVDGGSPDNCPAMCDEYAKKTSK